MAFAFTKYAFLYASSSGRSASPSLSGVFNKSSAGIDLPLPFKIY